MHVVTLCRNTLPSFDNLLELWLSQRIAVGEEEDNCSISERSWRRQTASQAALETAAYSRSVVDMCCFRDFQVTGPPWGKKHILRSIFDHPNLKHRSYLNSHGGFGQLHIQWINRRFVWCSVERGRPHSYGPWKVESQNARVRLLQRWYRAWSMLRDVLSSLHFADKLSYQQGHRLPKVSKYNRWIQRHSSWHRILHSEAF